jgi:BirA family transcriptional regulator, biotin operon repressor / biotin---[acetyl-CoA-carboxylase] ligase
MDRMPLDIERLRHDLLPRWNRVDVVAETASTNTDLLEDPSAPDRSVLVAENQIGGRGRLDRAWVSPPRAGLTVSVLLRPAVPLVRWGWLPLLAGVAVSEAVTATTGLATTLKWPNDLLAPPGGKLAGVLAQTADTAVVIGMGVNVSTTAEELPVGTATSLLLAGSPPIDRAELLVAILSDLDTRVAQWTDTLGDPAACGLAAAYRALSATIGTAVRVHVGDRVVTGQAIDIDEMGRLLLATDAGELAISAGDVEQLRPA